MTRLPALLVAVLLALTAAPGTAQTYDAVDGSVEQYEALRERLRLADERLGAAAPQTDERDEATDEVLAASEALIEYLSGWLRHPSFPEALRADAEVQRFVLFENLVQLYADRRLCAAAQGAALAMRAVAPPSLPPELQDLFSSATRVADRCVDWTPDPVLREAITARRPARSTAGWVFVGTGAASAVTSGVVALLGIDERRELRDTRAAQHRSWTVEQDAEMRQLGPAVLRNRRASIGLGAAGLALSGVGVALVVDPARRDRVRVVGGPNRAELRVRW